MENALSNLLANNAAIVAIVGDRISPLKRDDGFPAITYELTNAIVPTDISGQPTGNNQSTFLITAHTKTFEQGKALAELIKTQFNGLRGTVDNTVVKLTQFLGENHTHILEPDIYQFYINLNFIHN